MSWDSLESINKYNLVRNNNDFNALIKNISGEVYINLLDNGASICTDPIHGYYIPFSLNIQFEKIFNKSTTVIFNDCINDIKRLRNIYHFSYSVLENKRWFDIKTANNLINIYNKTFTWGNNYKNIINNTLLLFSEYEFVKKTIKNRDLEYLFYSVEMPFQKVLLHMRNNGIRFDTNKNIEIETRVDAYLEEILEKLKSYTNKNINFNSSTQLIELLYYDLGLPIQRYTESGEPACDEKSLKIMKTLDGNWIHPIISLIIKYRKLLKK